MRLHNCVHLLELKFIVLNYESGAVYFSPCSELDNGEEDFKTLAISP